MREKFRIHFEENEAAWLEGTISASERRILDATWLSESFTEFLAEGGQRKVRVHVKLLRYCAVIALLVRSDAFYTRPQNCPKHIFCICGILRRCRGCKWYIFGVSTSRRTTLSHGFDDRKCFTAWFVNIRVLTVSRYLGSDDTVMCRRD